MFELLTKFTVTPSRVHDILKEVYHRMFTARRLQIFHHRLTTMVKEISLKNWKWKTVEGRRKRVTTVPEQCSIRASRWALIMHKGKQTLRTISLLTSVSRTRPDFRSCLMIDLGRENDGNNEICLGVHFALWKMKNLSNYIIRDMWVKLKKMLSTVHANMPVGNLQKQSRWKRMFARATLPSTPCTPRFILSFRRTGDI